MSSAAGSRWRVLYHLARADFLERVRRYSFLFTLGTAVYFGYLAATGRIMLRLGNMRGIYNSAWIGALMSLVVTTFLSLVGFYVVKNTIERDRSTRVGQILASTPMSKFLYVIGKVLSNFAVFAVMVTILALSGIVMQALRGEDPHIELWKLLAPFLLLALPAMAGSVSGRVELRDSKDAAVRRKMDFSGVVVWLEPVNAKPFAAGRHAKEHRHRTANRRVTRLRSPRVYGSPAWRPAGMGGG